MPPSLDSAIEHLPDCFGLFEPELDEHGRVVDFRVVWLNHLARGEGGAAADMLLGEWAPAHEADNPLVAAFRQAHLAKRPVSHSAFHWTRQAGAEAVDLYYELHVVPTETGVAAWWRDVTLHHAVEEQLRQTQKMAAVGSLARGLAHELNNILQGVGGYTELAAATLAPDARAHRHLDKVAALSKRAGRLVEQLMTFSRAAPTPPGEISLRDLLRETLAFVRSTLPSRLTLHEIIGDDAAQVRADPDRLRQVIVHLCSNSAQATPTRGGQLTVRMSTADLSARDARGLSLEAGRYHILTFADTGEGMSAESTARAFEPFYTTRTDPERLGLGLTVVHGVVTECGGRVRLHSAGPGLGVTVQVHLPAGAVEGPAAEANKSKNTLSLLFIDDEEILVELAREGLPELGFQVTGLTSPRAALDVLRADPTGFDVVVTDLGMPTMSGLELSKLMREAVPGLPVVLCTGYRDTVDPTALREAGVAAVIGKPASISQMAAVLRGVLGR